VKRLSSLLLAHYRVSRVRVLLDYPGPIDSLRQRDDHTGIQSPLPRPPSLPEFLGRIPARFRIRSCLQSKSWQKIR